MKIMLQNHTFHPVVGGIENYLYHVAITLREMGHNAIIVCEKHDPTLSDFETYDGIDIIRHPYYFVSKPMLFMKPRVVANEIKRFLTKYVDGVDLIISRYPHYCFATCLLSLEIPVFYVPATVYWNYVKKSSKNSVLKEKFVSYLWKPIFKHMENKSIIMSKKVITLSRNISLSLAEHYNLNPERFIINKLGVDTNRFGNSYDPVGIRKEWKIPESSIVVIFVGRLSLEKNVARLIKEVNEIKRDNVHLLIVGDGPERFKLEDLTKELKMSGRITFVGLRNDVERFYAASDIFVLPSRYEAFGQVILEAMASRLPCIAFKKVLSEYEVASEEIIDDGATGFCVDPHTKDEFQERLLYLIDHPDMRKRMGLAGRKIVERDYTWEGHVRRLLDLMNN